MSQKHDVNELRQKVKDTKIQFNVLKKTQDSALKRQSELMEQLDVKNEELRQNNMHVIKLKGENKVLAAS